MDQTITMEYKLDENTTEKEVIDTVLQWTKDSMSYHSYMLRQQNINVEYYRGNQTDLVDIPVFSSNSVYNRIFEGTETLVPVVTGPAHQFLAIPPVENEISLRRARTLQKVLDHKYHTLEIQKKLETVVRDIILKRYGVMKWYWDDSIQDINVCTVDPRLILIPRMRVDANELPYVMEVQEYTKDELKQEFPDVNPENLIQGQQLVAIEDTQQYNQTITPNLDDVDASLYQIMEVSTDEYKVWLQGNTILRREKNPYWDWDGESITQYEKRVRGKKIVRKKIEVKKHYNYFKKPTKNYVFFTMFRTGDSPVGETSLAEIARPIQDDINVQKRQIVNNLVRMGNGQVYIDADAMEQERAESITSEPGLIIIGKNVASENKIRREAGVPLPSAHITNLQDSIAAFDNVFGIHAALRGQSQGGTLGAQIMNRNQDMSRIEQITRELNRGVSRLAMGIVQMMKMFYDVEQVIPLVGKDGSIDFISIMRSNIEDGVGIIVKDGTPVVLDPSQRYQQAIQLWQLGGIDPETFFERLDFADPQMMAKKLASWKSGQLILESQLRAAEATTAAAAQAQSKIGVETAGAMMNRQAAGEGAAAPISNPPKADGMSAPTPLA